jgi:ectoine hydroxylase-related dioxygenase (phytanoyl-CoA dioxygenase family)
MVLDRSHFFDCGFTVIKNFFDEKQIGVLRQEYDRLIHKSEQILQLTHDTGQPLSDYYQDKKELIVIPEQSDKLKICRFEYIRYSSPLVDRDYINPLLSQINTLIGQPFVLFKDKCNVKSPGGGGYGPHQDFTAYSHFIPRYHVSAALMLDDSKIENGCLYMALNYKNSIPSNIEWVNTQFGRMPFYKYYANGPRNGDILDEIASSLEWVPIEGKAGDVILFDSFAPHKSYANTSTASRRVFFFTFNAHSEGDYYDEYYFAKCRDFKSPKFHISTPTTHSTSVI